MQRGDRNYQKHYLHSQAALMQLFYGAGAIHQIKVVAAQLDIPLNTFYGYVNGERPCPVEVFRDIFHVTGYEPLLRVMEPPGYRMEPVEKAQPDQPSVEGELMSDVMEASKVCELWRRAIADGQIDSREYSALMTEIERLHHEVEATRTLLEKYNPDAPPDVTVVPRMHIRRAS